MGEETAILKLVPSNWFYNLSVYGFLRVLNDECKIDLEKEGVFKEDGSVEIDLDNYGLFKETEFISEEIKSVKLWDCLINAYLTTRQDYTDLEKKPLSEKHKKIRNSLFAKSGKFTNYINPSYFKFNVEPLLFKTLKDFLKFSSQKEEYIRKCQFCGEYPLLQDFLMIYPISNNILKKILESLNFLQIGQITILAPSLGKYPNSFWNLKSSVPLCLVCNILFPFYPLGIIDIGNNRKIFINAPSFKLIWKLNRHLEKIHSKEAIEDIKTLFGSAFINLVLDLNIKLGLWQRLSTEVIIFHGNNIDFYEIPPQILELLEDKEISTLLVKLNNFPVLELVISGKFNILEVLIHRFLRNFYRGFQNNDDLLKKFNLNQNDPQIGILLPKLYSLIVDKLKKSSEVLI
jgi:CRISPR-associated protein Cst1